MKNEMTVPKRMTLMLLLTAFAAAGCPEEDPLDEAGDKAEEAAEEVEDAVEDAGDAVEDATDGGV